MPTILVCDRDPVFVDTMRRLLAQEGYSIETAARPSETIQRLVPGRYGAMVLGLHSAEAEDVDVIPMINRIDRRLPIVVVASDESLELERRARSGKLFYYAVRPVDGDEIKEAIREACFRGRRSRDEDHKKPLTTVGGL